MRQFSYLICIALAAFAMKSCTSSTSQKTTVTESTSNDDKVLPNRNLSIEIEGMVCEKGCGASIRKALKSAGGVSSCTFDYKEDRKKNFAKVEYDDQKISAEKIIDIVTSINERQFEVGKTSSVQMDVKINVRERIVDESKSSESADINVSSRMMEMPNLLELFSGFLQS